MSWLYTQSVLKYMIQYNMSKLFEIENIIICNSNLPSATLSQNSISDYHLVSGLDLAIGGFFSSACSGVLRTEERT